MGYHKTKIKKGKLGRLSKIQEELDELQDGEEQGVRLLMLCELADIYGAVQAYLRRQFPGWEMQDLADMANLTAKAFEDGDR